VRNREQGDEMSRPRRLLKKLLRAVSRRASSGQGAARQGAARAHAKLMARPGAPTRWQSGGVQSRPRGVAGADPLRPHAATAFSRFLRGAASIMAFDWQNAASGIRVRLAATRT